MIHILKKIVRKNPLLKKILIVGAQNAASFSVSSRLSLSATALLLDSRNSTAERKFRKNLYDFAIYLQKLSFDKLMNVINSRAYLESIHPAHKSVDLSEKEQAFVRTLRQSLDDNTDSLETQKNFFIAMLYFQPYDLPEKTLFSLAFEAGRREFVTPLYRYIFNAFFPYSAVGEADRHIMFIERALKNFEKSLTLSFSSLSSEERLSVFRQAYTGSLCFSSRQNMKEIFSVERRLLKMVTDHLYPGIPDFSPPPPNERGHKIQLALLRYNYRGEIQYFTPILRHFDRKKYDIHILSFDENGIDEIKETFPEIQYHRLDLQNPAQSVAYIRGLTLDLLISSTSLSGDFYNPLAALLNYRLAPVQMIYCGDVVTSGIGAMDYFIVGEVYNTPILADEMVEKPLTVPGVGYFMPPPPRLEGNKNKLRLSLQILPSEVLYVSNSHIFKLTPDLISAWVAILKAVPHARLLLMPFSSDYIRDKYGRGFFKMIENICHDHNIDQKRIVISLAQGRQKIMENLKAGDIYLDSFPYSGPTSSIEALSLKLPVVSLDSPSFRGGFTAGFLKELKVGKTIAGSIDDYIKIAIDLAAAEPVRRELSEKIENAMMTASFYDTPTIAADLNRVFEKVIKR